MTTKRKPIEGKLVKHIHRVHHLSLIQRETTYLVKSSSPFISALKRIRKIAGKFGKNDEDRKFKGGEYKKIKYITVKGMGKAIEKTISLGLTLQNEFGFKVDFLTGTATVLDEFQQKDEEDSDDGYNQRSVYQNRSVSFTELHVWIKKE